MGEQEGVSRGDIGLQKERDLRRSRFELSLNRAGVFVFVDDSDDGEWASEWELIVFRVVNIEGQEKTKEH